MFLQDIVPGTGPGNSPRAAAAIAAAGKTPGEVRMCLLFVLSSLCSFSLPVFVNLSVSFDLSSPLFCPILSSDCLVFTSVHSVSITCVPHTISALYYIFPIVFAFFLSILSCIEISSYLII